jgi:signal transduction histidine kinase
VVQEGLTNARKHAPGEPVAVTFAGRPGARLEVSVVSRLAPGTVAAAVPGTGTGLIGLAERLELAGGGLESAAGGGEFRLRAWLPWPDPADTGAAYADPPDAAGTYGSVTDGGMTGTG